jgi:hypothetical protein
MKIVTSTLVFFILLSLGPSVKASSGSHGDYSIYCVSFKAPNRNEDGYLAGEYQILDTWMRISFDQKLLWPADLTDFNPADIEFESEEDNAFGIISVVEGEFKLIGESRLPLLPEDRNVSNAMASQGSVFVLTQECAEHLMNIAGGSRDGDNVRFDHGWMTDEVRFCYNQIGSCIYDRCDLDHRLLVIKYSRTRWGDVPYSWFFMRIAFTTPAGETSTALVPCQAGYFLEYPYNCDTWDLYWAYSIGNSDAIYDPTLYHEWWTFVSYIQLPKFDSSDETRPIVYISNRIPGSMADFLEFSKYGTIDSGG